MVYNLSHHRCPKLQSYDTPNTSKQGSALHPYELAPVTSRNTWLLNLCSLFQDMEL